MAGFATFRSGALVKEAVLVPCPFLTLTGIPCPGCGMTRSCLALVHGDLALAWSYHPFSFLLVSIAAAFAFFPGRLRLAWSRLSRPARQITVLCGIALALGRWISRLPFLDS